MKIQVLFFILLSSPLVLGQSTEKTSPRIKTTVDHEGKEKTVNQVINTNDFVPPFVKNWSENYSYIAPKYGLMSYFPLIYIGQPIDTICKSYLKFVYPDSLSIVEMTSHNLANIPNQHLITTRTIAIDLIPENRFWVAQPSIWGEDTMEYHSASSVILRNLSNDTIIVGKDLVLNMMLQYFDGATWQNTENNPSESFLLPEMKGLLAFYPGEIIVTAIPLYEGEHRKLRIVLDEAISEEFNISYNDKK